MGAVLGEHQLDTVVPTDLEDHTTTHSLQHAAAHGALTHERALVDQTHLASDRHRVAVQPVTLAAYQYAHLRPHPGGEADVDGLLVTDRADRGVTGAHIEQRLERHGGVASGATGAAIGNVSQHDGPTRGRHSPTHSLLWRGRMHDPVVALGHSCISDLPGQPCGQVRVVISDDRTREARGRDVRKGKATKGGNADDPGVFFEAVHQVDNAL